MLQKKEWRCFRSNSLYRITGLGVGVEAVHESQTHTAGRGLLNDDLQKGLVILNLKQAFGAGQAHAGAQTTVEHDQYGPAHGF